MESRGIGHQPEHRGGLADTALGAGAELFDEARSEQLGDQLRRRRPGQVGRPSQVGAAERPVAGDRAEDEGLIVPASITRNDPAAQATPTSERRCAVRAFPHTHNLFVYLTNELPVKPPSPIWA